MSDDKNKKALQPTDLLDIHMPTGAILRTNEDVLAYKDGERWQGFRPGSEPLNRPPPPVPPPSSKLPG